MLTNPVLLAEEISSQFIKIKLKQFEQNDIKTSQLVATESVVRPYRLSIVA